ncbi:MAG: MaoC family dehydratase N-terminal domain-containing protein [Actinobacteria bacterium]|nr:MaoC family dehydratase N-terminal domain-containing protein [Actinomycetota bacterium]
MTTITPFDMSRLGEWRPAGRFPVERSRSIAYAEATNDPIRSHLDGTYAPPLFAVVAAIDPLVAAIRSIVPPDAVMRGVHGEQDMIFHRPIVPGETLEVRSIGVGVRVRSSGTVAIVKAEIRGERGDLVNEQWMSYFVRGVIAEGDAGEGMPEQGDRGSGEAEPRTCVQTIDEDQTFRYADASGDRMPIHLDADVARSVGLPGIIVHGLCTMAFTSHAVINSFADGDPTRLRRHFVRFAGILEPGQAITTTLRKADGGPPQAILFETRAANGDLVIRDGLAEIAG